MSEAVVPLLAKILHYSQQLLQAGNAATAGQRTVSLLREVLPVDRAVLVSIRKAKIVAVDAGLDHLRDAEFADVVRKIARQKGLDAAPWLPSDDTDPRPEALRAKMGGSALLWLPIAVHGVVTHGLWLERWGGQQWSDNDVNLLNRISVFIGAALAQQKPKRRLPWGWIALALVIAAMFIPVQQSAVAPGAVLPVEPFHVSAPMGGVIKTVHVQAGQQVAAKQLLASYDKDVIYRSLEEAVAEKRLAEQEAQRLRQLSHRDAEALAKYKVQQLVVKKAQATLAFQQEQGKKADIYAPAAGVVVASRLEELPGTRVDMGQRLFSVANPARTHVRMMVPVADAGLFAVGAEVSVRLDSDPLTSQEAKVRRVGFEVVRSVDDVPSIEVDAEWLRPTQVLPGQQLQARIYGEQTFLGMQLFRKPIQELTGWLGF